MRAKATQYWHYTFRSRLEAYLYEYVYLKFDPEVLEYEPKHYSTEFYVPDFIVSSDKYHFSVEVKPTLEKADWNKYRKWMDIYTSIQAMFVFTKDEWEMLDKHGNYAKGEHDKMLYFQAINNVKEYLRNTDQE
jgi:hypothetical protein